MKICILIPAHNEEETIGSLVEAIKQFSCDVVVMDDGSEDHTGEWAKAAGAIVLANSQKSGKGAALQKGFDYVLQGDYSGVITMDGDGQHAPEDLKVFIDAAQEYPKCIVAGNRMGNSRGMPLVRYLTNRFMSILISGECHQSIPDTQCGYRYIDGEVLRRIRNQLTCQGFEVESEILMKAAKQGVKIYSVPVKTIYRNEKSKINPLKDTIKFFTYFIKEICPFNN